MARIRSIKPDFFTSETIASLPLSARLTFIGLWTYVDDNGVGLDNELLITAAIWPLERDNLETLARTREDLARISREGLVTRYADSRKRYLHVTSWKEHQKVDHPGKPRYPMPDDPAVAGTVTCGNGNGPAILAKDSRESREELAPEQGAGSREQGAGNSRPAKPAPAKRGTKPAAKDEPLPGAPDRPETPSERANRLARVYTDRVPLTNFPAVAAIVRKAVDAKVDDDAITDGLNKIAADGVSLTTESLRKAIYGSGKPAGHQTYQNPPDDSVYDRNYGE